MTPPPRGAQQAQPGLRAARQSQVAVWAHPGGMGTQVPPLKPADGSQVAELELSFFARQYCPIGQIVFPHGTGSSRPASTGVQENPPE